jgi:hypothetical protein
MNTSAAVSVKPGADDGFLSGEIENICFHPVCFVRVIRRRRGGQSSDQFFVHVTLAPAMIGYTRKMFRDFVGIMPPADGGQRFLVMYGSFVYVTLAPAMIGYTRDLAV